eukprot:Phypoly_transcript_19486.p1 GENE.Phypoly_transcript_19486~~Phypoly_transcript_19486.p1  ORF type:complete len:172 (+),score=19.76 Phypoly_transcript_19486:165-680(+)
MIAHLKTHPLFIFRKRIATRVRLYEMIHPRAEYRSAPPGILTNQEVSRFISQRHPKNHSNPRKGKLPRGIVGVAKRKFAKSSKSIEVFEFYAKKSPEYWKERRIYVQTILDQQNKKAQQNSKTSTWSYRGGLGGLRNLKQEMKNQRAKKQVIDADTNEITNIEAIECIEID